MICLHHLPGGLPRWIGRRSGDLKRRKPRTAATAAPIAGRVWDGTADRLLVFQDGDAKRQDFCGPKIVRFFGLVRGISDDFFLSKRNASCESDLVTSFLPPVSACGPTTQMNLGFPKRVAKLTRGERENHVPNLCGVSSLKEMQGL